MTREIRMRAGVYNESSVEPDCFLDPDDPAQALLQSQALGISLEAAQARMTAHKQEQIRAERENSWEMTYAREHKIRPGTPAWAALWGK